jgi:hypothetical protein
MRNEKRAWIPDYAFISRNSCRKLLQIRPVWIKIATDLYGRWDRDRVCTHEVLNMLQVGVQSPCAKQVFLRTDWIPLSPHWVNQFACGKACGSRPLSLREPLQDDDACGMGKTANSPPFTHKPRQLHGFQLATAALAYFIIKHPVLVVVVVK